MVSPVTISSNTKDPLLLEVARLRAGVSMPQRSVTIDGEKVKLTPEQYHYYVQLAGKPAKQHLDEYIRTPEWQEMDDEQRREYIGETVKEARASARDQIKEMILGPDSGAAAEPPPLPPGATLVQ